MKKFANREELLRHFDTDQTSYTPQRKGEHTVSDAIGPAEVVVFAGGKEATGRELARRAAGLELVELTYQRMAEHGGEFHDALTVVRRLHPELDCAYQQYSIPLHD